MPADIAVDAATTAKQRRIYRPPAPNSESTHKMISLVCSCYCMTLRLFIFQVVLIALGCSSSMVWWCTVLFRLVIQSCAAVVLFRYFVVNDFFKSLIIGYKLT